MQKSLKEPGSSECSCAEECLVKSLSSAPRLESPLAWDFLAGISEGTAPPQRVLLPPEKICMACQQTGSVRAGLYKLGNRCFLKSILQRLSAESREGGRGRSRAVPAPAVASSGPSCVPVSPGAGSAWAEVCALPREEPLPRSERLGRPRGRSCRRCWAVPALSPCSPAHCRVTKGVTGPGGPKGRPRAACAALSPRAGGCAGKSERRLSSTARSLGSSLSAFCSTFSFSCWKCHPFFLPPLPPVAVGGKVNSLFPFGQGLA